MTPSRRRRHRRQPPPDQAWAWPYFALGAIFTLLLALYWAGLLQP